MCCAFSLFFFFGIDILALRKKHTHNRHEIRRNSGQRNLRDNLINLRNQNTQIEDKQRHFREGRGTDIEDHADPRDFARHDYDVRVAGVEIPYMCFPAIVLNGDDDQDGEDYAGEIGRDDEDVV